MTQNWCQNSPFPSPDTQPSIVCGSPLWAKNCPEFSERWKQKVSPHPAHPEATNTNTLYESRCPQVRGTVCGGPLNLPTVPVPQSPLFSLRINPSYQVPKQRCTTITSKQPMNQPRSPLTLPFGCWEKII